MQEYWETYMKPVDGYPATLSFNVEIADGSLVQDHIYMGYVKLYLQHPDEQGLLSTQEQEEVAFIEDLIEMEALRYRVGKYVGRITSNEAVTFIYYLKLNFEWEDAVKSAMNKIEHYQYEFGSREDMQWDVYNKLLYPTAKEWQMIHNRFTCKMLQKAGDSLTIKRAIEHKSYFSDAENREKYKQFLLQEGFLIQNEFNHENYYGLQFYRFDIPDVHNMDRLTFFLIDSSNEYQGEYDGWESSVVQN